MVAMVSARSAAMGFNRLVDARFDALNPRKGVSGITKPKGVTTALNDGTGKATVESLPNLFVNLVDTVSGRILYRASHTNAAESDSVPVLISENWVIYAFFNEMTKRSELGVLSLHEGMMIRKEEKGGIIQLQYHFFQYLRYCNRLHADIILARCFTVIGSADAG